MSFLPCDRSSAVLHPTANRPNIGHWRSRTCTDQIASTGLSHDDSSGTKPRAASFCCMVSMVDSSAASLPGIKVSVCMIGGSKREKVREDATFRRRRKAGVQPLAGRSGRQCPNTGGSPAPQRHHQSSPGSATTKGHCGAGIAPGAKHFAYCTLPIYELINTFAAMIFSSVLPARWVQIAASRASLSAPSSIAPIARCKSTLSCVTRCTLDFAKIITS